MSCKNFTVSESDYTIDKETNDVDVQIWLSDIFSEIDDDELAEEVNERGLNTEIFTQEIVDVKDYTNEQFKRLICDFIGVNYHTKIDELINAIIKKLDENFWTRRDDEALEYSIKYKKCIEVIKRFDAGIIGMYDL